MAGEKFFGLEAARGIAAMMVAMVHASLITAEPRFFATAPFDGLTRNFGAGVDFFFVLSGFIIAWTHGGDIGRPERLTLYIRKRFQRIYPIYWTILIPVIVIYHAVPSFGTADRRDWWLAAGSFFLLPTGTHPTLGVAWSLQYEIVFYVLFGLAIVRPLPALVIAGGLATAGVIAGVASVTWVFPWSFFANPRMVEFAVGVGAAGFLRHRTVPAAAAVFALGAAGFAAGLLWLPAGAGAAAACFGLASAAIVSGLVELERSGRIPRLRLFAAMGACSYAIYLTHAVAESLFERPVLLLRHAIPVDAATLLIWVAGVAAGVAVHYYVELPMSGLAGRLLSRTA